MDNLVLKKIIIVSLFLFSILIAYVLYYVWNSFEYVHIDEYAPFKVIESKVDSDNVIENSMPSIDAAVAFYPLASNMVEKLYDKTIYNNELSWASTDEAYVHIINGEVDCIIASAPSKAQAKAIRESNKEFKFVPIAKEALIFYVNNQNTISSLTIKEIEKIYNGEIINWQDVGGLDRRITTYQLEKNNGSQTAFESIVENNTIDKNHEEVADMISIIKEVVHNKNSIAYAFNSFYRQQFNSSKLKLLCVDEIEPTKENIVLGKYPLMYEIYLIYNINTVNKNVIKLEEWLLSEEGQDLCENMGYQRITEEKLT